MTQAITHLFMLLFSAAVYFHCAISVPLHTSQTQSDPTNTAVFFDFNPYMQHDYIFPRIPSAANPSIYGVLDELKAWFDLTIFTTLVQHGEYFEAHQDDEMMIMAPTNRAFFQLVDDVHNVVTETSSSNVTLETVLNKLFEKLIAAHVVNGSWTEFKVVEQQQLTTASGASLNTTLFPEILAPASNSSASRLFRPMKTGSGTGALICFIDRVLLPHPIRDMIGAIIRNETVNRQSDGADSQTDTLTIHSDVVESPVNGYLHIRPGHEESGLGCPTGCDDFREQVVLRSVMDYETALAYQADRLTFLSVIEFLKARKDCVIFWSLIRYTPGVRRAIRLQSELGSKPLHILVPTDQALLAGSGHSSFRNDGEESRLLLHNRQHRMKKLVFKLNSVWSSTTGAPPLASVILDHVCFDAAKPVHSMKGESLRTASGSTIRVSDDGMTVTHEKYRYDPANVISSHATMDGFVSPLQGRLNVNDRLIGELLDMFHMMMVKEHEKRESAEATSEPVLPTPFGDDEKEVEDDGTEEDDEGDDGENIRSSTEPQTPRPEPPNGACFPGDAELIGSDGQAITMRNLKGGHMIRVSASSRLSKVIAFTHREHSKLFPFLRISLSNVTSITVSEGHYVYVDRRITAASAVRIGQRMPGVHGEDLVVSDINKVWKTGRYAPHTVHGDLVVNGVVVSAYTTAVHPWIAHALLAPVRLFSLLSGLDEPLGSLFYRGCERLSGVLPKGSVKY